jgi:probable HAF family extracellular repeat protein
MAAIPAHAQVTITDLGAINGGTNSSANGINASGHIAGGAYDADGLQHAVLWIEGTVTDLGTLCEGCSTGALDVNDTDTVVGFASTPSGERGFVWQTGTMTELPPLPGDQRSIAYAINNNGWIVGQSASAAGFSQPVLWVDGVPEGLGVFGAPSFGTAFDVNDAGEVVGQASTAGGGIHAFHWANGVLTDLGGTTDPGPYGDIGAAQGINASGVVVGFAITTDGRYVAERWENGIRTDLPPLAPANQYSIARRINTAGDIAGMATNQFGATHAVLWHEGEILDLGVVVATSLAMDVNDAGLIVGRSQMPPSGADERGVLFTRQQPNTAPEVYVPANITAEGDALGGAQVSFTASGSDAEDGVLVPDCAPSSGSLFPLGITAVECTVSDSGGLSTSNTFLVSVFDTVGPVISGVPASIVTDATTPSGAVVTYALPSALDTVAGAVASVCTPPPGSVFPIGVTTVHCTATDGSGNTSGASFTVTVRNASAEWDALALLVTGVGPGQSLAAKVRSARTAFEAGDVATAVSSLRSLLEEVRAQTGKKITAAQAADINASVAHVLGAIGA